MRGRPPPTDPAHPEWDLPCDEAPFAFVDLEMTGLDVERDRVVEICVERVVGGECVGRLDSLVWPGEERAGGASEVHGLTSDALRGAPTFAELAPRVRELLAGAVPVAHAASWDQRFLRAELARLELDLGLEHWIDTLWLSRRSFLFQTHSLAALRGHFGLDAEGSHRASGDVAALREVFRRCAEVLRPVSPRDLWESLSTSDHARAVVMEGLFAAQAAGLPVKIAVRSSGKPVREVVVVVTDVLSDVDPPRAIGYLLPGRGRRELRADRILRIEPLPAKPT